LNLANTLIRLGRIVYLCCCSATTANRLLPIHDPSPPPAPLLIGLNKSIDGTIIGSLHIIREKACRQFTQLPMIGNALTANALPAAWFVGTVATGFVLLNAALSHIQLLLR